MSATVENLILDLVEWVEAKPRSYQETMEAWRTSCPRLPVWEDANDRGLVELTSVDGRTLVRATPVALSLLEQHRPQAARLLRAQAGDSSPAPPGSAR